MPWFEASVRAHELVNPRSVKEVNDHGRDGIQSSRHRQPRREAGTARLVRHRARPPLRSPGSRHGPRGTVERGTRHHRARRATTPSSSTMTSPISAPSWLRHSLRGCEPRNGAPYASASAPPAPAAAASVPVLAGAASAPAGSAAIESAASGTTSGGLTCAPSWWRCPSKMPIVHPHQLGLLKAIGRTAGFDVESLHANLDFAARIGDETYAALCDHRGRLVGEWVFSIAAFGDSAPDPDGRLLTRLPQRPSVPRRPDLARLDQMRAREVPQYLDELVDGYPWDDVQVVGFTSTFQQNTASFALARRLKQKFPHLVTLFGGANFEGEMGAELVRAIELHRSRGRGRGRHRIPRRCCPRSRMGVTPETLPGVIRRPPPRRRAPASSSAATKRLALVAMDDLPIPDYDEYFERRRNLSLASEGSVIPFESGRGCWWGAKHHCTFCGLNGTNMHWRAKSPQRVRQELAYQAEPVRHLRLRRGRQHPRTEISDVAVAGARGRGDRLRPVLRGQGEPQSSADSVACPGRRPSYPARHRVSQFRGPAPDEQGRTQCPERQPAADGRSTTASPPRGT